MREDAFGMIDLSGRWAGFYRHRSEQFGTFLVTAELRQEGDWFTGEMVDAITDRSDLLDSLLEAQPSDLSAAQRIRLEGLIERFGPGCVVLETRLPETSVLKGKVVGNRVAFTKTYRGTMHVRLRAQGNVLYQTARDRHTVHYSGDLDSETGRLSGQWVIRRAGWFGRFLRPAARGSFELARTR
jgi:hypothetical protein